MAAAPGWRGIEITVSETQRWETRHVLTQKRVSTDEGVEPNGHGRLYPT